MALSREKITEGVIAAVVAAGVLGLIGWVFPAIWEWVVANTKTVWAALLTSVPTPAWFLLLVIVGLIVVAFRLRRRASIEVLTEAMPPAPTPEDDAPPSRSKMSKQKPGTSDADGKRISLLDLYAEAIKRGLPFGNEGFQPFTDDLREAGNLADLQFFGRAFDPMQQWSKQPLGEIKKEHWEQYKIDLTTVVDYDLVQQTCKLFPDNTLVSTYRSGSNVRGYQDLHVLQGQSLQWLEGEYKKRGSSNSILCPNCKYYDAVENVPVCLRNMNVATGKHWSCHDTRSDPNLCGKKGLWFEKK